MANEVLRTHNDINALDFSTFEAVDFDIFLALCIKLRNQSDKRVTISADELREFINYDGKDRKLFAKALERSHDRLLRLHTKIYEDGVIGFNIFQAYHIPADASEVTVLFSEPARYLITDRDNLYIYAKWHEYKLMNTSYSRRLYLLLKQWRTAQKDYYYKYGGHKWRMEDWRSLMGIPESYTQSDIDKRILIPAMRDFAAAGCFVPVKGIWFYRKLKMGKGNRITHIEFRFTPESEPKTEVVRLDTKTKAEKSEDLRKKAAAAKVEGNIFDEARFANLADTIDGERKWMAAKDIPDVSTFEPIEGQVTIDDLEVAKVGRFKAILTKVFGK
jgi:plasmid replication initiation protein